MKTFFGYTVLALLLVVLYVLGDWLGGMLGLGLQIAAVIYLIMLLGWALMSWYASRNIVRPRAMRKVRNQVGRYHLCADRAALNMYESLKSVQGQLDPKLADDVATATRMLNDTKVLFDELDFEPNETSLAAALRVRDEFWTAESLAMAVTQKITDSHSAARVYRSIRAQQDLKKSTRPTQSPRRVSDSGYGGTFGLLKGPDDSTGGDSSSCSSGD